jgi:tRNA pseudouridine38-40 synthase
MVSHRVAIVLQYVGTEFLGWQSQTKGRTVQDELEQVLVEVAGHPVRVHAAGRTDTGVHAAAQVVHFDTTSLIPAPRWMKVLNSRLPEDMMVRASAAVSADWHARFSANWRRYRYIIYNDRTPNLFLRPLVWHYYQAELDVEKMQAAMDPLVGRYHFSAFQRAGSVRPHAWTEIQAVSCRRRGPFVEIEIQASGFLYGMVRLLVGMLVQVGEGSRSLEDFTRIWRNEERDRVRHAAPAQGLCLLRVGYPESPFPQDTWFEAQPLFWFPEGPPAPQLGDSAG